MGKALLCLLVGCGEPETETYRAHLLTLNGFHVGDGVSDGGESGNNRLFFLLRLLRRSLRCG